MGQGVFLLQRLGNYIKSECGSIHESYLYKFWEFITSFIPTIVRRPTVDRFHIPTLKMHIDFHSHIVSVSQRQT